MFGYVLGEPEGTYYKEAVNQALGRNWFILTDTSIVVKKKKKKKDLGFVQAFNRYTVQKIEVQSYNYNSWALGLGCLDSNFDLLIM